MGHPQRRTVHRLPGGRVPQGAGGGHQGDRGPPHQDEAGRRRARPPRHRQRASVACCCCTADCKGLSLLLIVYSTVNVHTHSTLHINCTCVTYHNDPTLVHNVIRTTCTTVYNSI